MLDRVRIDPTSRTIRPDAVEADEYFGLTPRTNGTAAECRRALVQPAGYRWIQSTGRLPSGLNYVVPTVCAEEF